MARVYKDKKIINEAIRNFDFESYVYERFDETYETGKSYRIRAHCPFCEETDTRGHFYIHIPLRLVYCQKCKYDPRWLPKFLSDLEGISLDEAIAFLTDEDIYLGEKQTVEDVVAKVLEVPDEGDGFEYNALILGHEFVPVLDTFGLPIIDLKLQGAREYLFDRGITKEQILNYNIMYCYDGKFAGRIIVPTYWEGDVVTFVARDMYDSGAPKYLVPEANDNGNFLFNYDNVSGGTIIVTEGVFDAIAVGDNAVATFGKSLSARQAMLLNVFAEVIFYWDVDAYEQVAKYAKNLNGIVRKVLHSGADDAGSRSVELNKQFIGGAVLNKSVESILFDII